MNTNAAQPISLLIKKHIALLGSAAALSRARKVPGVTVAENGDIIRITRDPDIVREELERAYASFAGIASRIIARSLRDAALE